MSERLLLDTCAALWYWSGSERLSDEIVEAIRDPENVIVFHQVSCLEITHLRSKSPSVIEGESFRLKPPERR